MFMELEPAKLELELAVRLCLTIRVTSPPLQIAVISALQLVLYTYQEGRFFSVDFTVRKCGGNTK